MPETSTFILCSRLQANGDWLCASLLLLKRVNKTEVLDSTFTPLLIGSSRVTFVSNAWKAKADGHTFKSHTIRALKMYTRQIGELESKCYEGWRGKNMRIEFTSADESWLIAISESSQAANTSGASPAGRKREADGDRGEKKERKKTNAPPDSLPSIFSSIIIHVSSAHCAMYHISCRIAIIAARSKQYVLMPYHEKKNDPCISRGHSLVCTL